VLLIAGLAGVVGLAVGVPVGRVLSSQFANPPTAAAVRAAAIVVAIVLAAAGGLVANRQGASEWLNVSLGLRSRLDVIVADEYKSLVSHPKFREATRGKSPAEVRALAATLTAAGFQYLELPDLQEWARIKLQMAERSATLCAGMWRGRQDPALGTRALGDLAEPDLRAWARLSAKASRHALDGGPSPSVREDARFKGLEHIVSKLADGERQAVLTDMARADVSDERACELMRMVLQGSRHLPADLQREFLRELTRT
jgi:hypothetical protein